MIRRDSKVCIVFLDLFVCVLFLVPLALAAIFNRKKSLYPRKILIMELWGIGDLVMMSAILKPLKENYPKARITVLSKEVSKTLFKDDSRVDEFINFYFPWTRFRKKYALWSWDWPGLFRIIARLRKEKFDLVLDARGDIRNNLLSFLSGGKIRLGYGWRGGGFFLTDNLRDAGKNLHRIDAWVNLLKYLRIGADNCEPYLSVNKEEEAFADDFLEANGISRKDLLVGIHPGAGIKTRCWPLERFARTAEYARDICKSRVIIFLEPEGYGAEIPIEGESLKVKLNLRQLTGLIKRLDLLICNDGGVMHIATAVNTAVVAIFGPGSPSWFGPYGAKSTMILENDIPCRPCFDYCKHNKAICLDRITVNRVNVVIGNVLGGLNTNK